MAFLARSVRGEQDPPATEAMPSQPSQPSTPPFRVGLFLRISACGLGLVQQRSLARRSSTGYSNPFHPDSRHDADKRTCLYSTWLSLRFWQPDHHLERQQTRCTAAAAARTVGSLTTPSTTVLAPRPHLPTEIAVFKNSSSNVKPPHRCPAIRIRDLRDFAASSQATGPVGMIFGSKIHPVADLGRALGPSKLLQNLN